MSISKRALTVLTGFLFAGFALLVPFELVIAPERELQIMDEAGKPVPKAVVRQIWYQYSLGIRGQEDFTSTPTGSVFLPKRSAHTRLLSLGIGALRQFQRHFIHAGYGSHETMVVSAKDHANYFIYDGKGISQPKNVIVLTAKP